MKIRFLQNIISDPIYRKGQEIELDDKLAKYYVKIGFAIEVIEPKTNRKKNLKNVENR